MRLRSITLSDIVRRNASLHPDGQAFVFGDRRITHAAFRARVERLAAALSKLGIGVGDRIVVLANNSLEFVDLYGAAAWLGAILTPVNWRLSADEIAFIVGDAAPKIVIADQANQGAFATARPEFAAVARWIGVDGGAAPFEPLEAFLDADDAPPPPHGEAGPFVMIHTAAVGGRPRGALLSQAGLLANALQAVAGWSLTEQDTAYGALPLFHVAGLNLLLACLYAGGASVIATRFDAQEAARTIAAERITVFAEFAPMLGSLLDATPDGASLSSIRIVTGLDTPETIARFEGLCAQARFFVAFGQTETSGFVTMAPFRDRPGAAGRPMLLSEVAVVDEADRPLATGEVGEIVVRGPCVFEGYWNRPEDSAQTFRSDWHHTGDNGAFDAAGYLWYKGRSPAKELIKPGGENVYPAEVEAALKAHPAIADAVVFGVPDKDWGEAVRAVGALRAGASATPEEIIAFVAGRIARYKRPKALLLVDDLPRKPDGAIDRTKTKELYA